MNKCNGGSVNSLYIFLAQVYFPVMLETVNPRTGLKETWDANFRVPIVYQRSVGSLKFGGQLSAIHTVPLAQGLSLDFYAHLCRSEELVVAFPGALLPKKNIYPLFPRVKVLRRKAKAMMSFADPKIGRAHV